MSIEIIARLEAFLAETITVRRELGPTVEMTRGARLAELIGVNGGQYVNGWGITSGGGLYGHMGLTQDEAMELIETNSFVQGVMFAVPEVKSFIERMLHGHWKTQADRLPRIVKASGG